MVDRSLMNHGFKLQEHLNLGKALKPLRDEGVLIVGSGLGFHNMGVFRQTGFTSTTAESDSRAKVPLTL